MGNCVAAPRPHSGDAAFGVFFPSRKRSVEGMVAERAVGRGLAYLRNSQRDDGAWLPLWFGNELAPDEHNGVYGTGRVLSCLLQAGFDRESMLVAGGRWLVSVQNRDGGWGGDRDVQSSIEETAVAVEALGRLVLAGDADEKITQAVQSGAQWLIENTQQGTEFPAAPIGLYFARLWYFEKLYPITFALRALGVVRRLG